MADKITTRFLRNKDLIQQDNLDEITLIGLGGIGSFLVQGLATMGWKMVIGYDSDIVENHNLSSTCYPVQDVGKKKADASVELFNRYSEEWQTFLGITSNYDGRHIITPKAIVCTDNMESRLKVYKKWSQLEDRQFLLDMRMGATSVELVTVTQTHDEYMDSWIPTISVPPAPCSQKHTVFATQNIVSLGLAQLYNLTSELAYYDSIWSSLTPNMIECGNLVLPAVTS